MAQVGNRTNLEKTVGVDEQVARLDVTMKNVSGMQIFQPYNTAQQCRQLLFTTTYITNSLKVTCLQHSPAMPPTAHHDYTHN